MAIYTLSESQQKTLHTALDAYIMQQDNHKFDILESIKLNDINKTVTPNRGALLKEVYKLDIMLDEGFELLQSLQQLD